MDRISETLSIPNTCGNRKVITKLEELQFNSFRK